MRYSGRSGAGNRTFLMSQNQTLLKSSDISIVDNFNYVKFDVECSGIYSHVGALAVHVGEIWLEFGFDLVNRS
jgi:hypothetical protein